MLWKQHAQYSNISVMVKGYTIILWHENQDFDDDFFFISHILCEHAYRDTKTTSKIRKFKEFAVVCPSRSINVQGRRFRFAN